MTRRERKERKLEKRLDWAESRDKKANQENRAGHELSDNIPMGQPVLIGHHSQKRHEKDLNRIHSHGLKSYEHSKMADHHREKAENLKRQLNNTIFSDDKDAIEKLQLKLNKLERGRDRMKQVNKALKKNENINLADSEKKMLESNQKVWGDYKFMPYELTNLGARIRSIKKRIEKLKSK